MWEALAILVVITVLAWKLRPWQSACYPVSSQAPRSWKPTALNERYSVILASSVIRKSVELGHLGPVADDYSWDKPIAQIESISGTYIRLSEGGSPGDAYPFESQPAFAVSFVSVVGSEEVYDVLTAYVIRDAVYVLGDLRRASFNVAINEPKLVDLADRHPA